ncbi:MAG: aminotransferase class V-fold PLP-dependent enzyme [Micromonosporaceae bacterium]|nr:aminotransferase class V-fold PLP-dependent enzyme [Micromonosporaceae bacterium]
MPSTVLAPCHVSAVTPSPRRPLSLVSGSSDAAPRLALVGEGLTTPLSTGGEVEYANFDYAASAPCLASVAAAVTEALGEYASAHRGAGLPSQRTTERYELARVAVGEFLGCREDDAVVFTRNTTDAMNLLAHALPNDARVVVFASEHHATLLPWREPVRLPAPSILVEAVRSVDAALRELRRGGDDAPILVAVTGASNVTGELWPVAEIGLVAHRHGARVALDAAQLAPHCAVNVAALGVDYVAISGHKLYAPFGAGALAGRADWLEAATPYLAGGGASSHVGDATHDIGWAAGPARHEAGTPNVVGAVALAEACRALAEADQAALAVGEAALLTRLRRGLNAIPGLHDLTLFGPDCPRVGIAAFAVEGLDSGELARVLSDEYGIGVRAGLFCAHPLTRRLLLDAALPATAVRASLGVGSTEAQVDRLVTAVAEISQRSAAR